MTKGKATPERFVWRCDGGFYIAYYKVPDSWRRPGRSGGYAEIISGPYKTRKYAEKVLARTQTQPKGGGRKAAGTREG
jgi:hypothetical protein